MRGRPSAASAGCSACPWPCCPGCRRSLRRTPGRQIHGWCRILRGSRCRLLPAQLLRDSLPVPKVRLPGMDSQKPAHVTGRRQVPNGNRGRRSSTSRCGRRCHLVLRRRVCRLISVRRHPDPVQPRLPWTVPPHYHPITTPGPAVPLRQATLNDMYGKMRAIDALTNRRCGAENIPVTADVAPSQLWTDAVCPISAMPTTESSA